MRHSGNFHDGTMRFIRLGSRARSGNSLARIARPRSPVRARLMSDGAPVARSPLGDGVAAPRRSHPARESAALLDDCFPSRPNPFSGTADVHCPRRHLNAHRTGGKTMPTSLAARLTAVLVLVAGSAAAEGEDATVVLG